MTLQQGRINADHHENGSYSFQDIFEAIAGSQKFEELLELILRVCQQELDADQGSILLLKEDDEGVQRLEMLASRGLPDEIVRRGYVPRKGSISDHVLKERRPIIINDAPSTDKFEVMTVAATERRIVSALCVPLIAQGRVLGTLNLNRIHPEITLFNEVDLEAASIVAGQAAMLIENRRLQDELLVQARMAAIGQTVAGISHCIKNILTGVKGGLGLAEMGLQQQNLPLTAQGYDMLKRNVGSLSNLVLDLLDYSKEREPTRSDLDLVETVRDVKESLDYRANSLGVRIVLETPATMSYRGDGDQLQRALMNLVSNALDASSELRGGDAEPEVRLRVYRVGSHADDLSASMITRSSEWIRIDISDNGPGIPPEMQEKIWDLFFSTKGSKGTGIGLATTQKMIHEHGGRIHCESTPGSGATFSVLLPVERR